MSHKIYILDIIIQIFLLLLLPIAQVSLLYGLLMLERMILPREIEMIISLFSDLTMWAIVVFLFWILQKAAEKLLPSSWKRRGMYMFYVALIHGALWSLGVLAPLESMELWQVILLTVLGIPGVLFSFVLIGPVRQQLALEETWPSFGENGLLIVSFFFMGIAMIFVDQLTSLQLVEMLP